MDFSSEYELQEAVADWLIYLGYDVATEVPSGGGRIDILTDQYIIEIKPRLTREALFQAAGQLVTYQDSFPEHEKVIAGLTPNSNQSSAYSTAERLQLQGYEVWFLDAESSFREFIEPIEEEQPEFAYASGYEDGSSEELEDIFGYPQSRTYSSSSSFDSDSLGGIVGVIAVGTFIVIGGAIGFSNSANPLQRYAHLTYPGSNPKSNLYHEVKEWDVNGAVKSIHQLMASTDQCDQLFGRQLNDTLALRNHDPSTLENFKSVVQLIEKDTECYW